MSAPSPTPHPSHVQRLTDVHQRLVDAVEELTSGDAWRHMLEVAARLPTYSPSNVLLIAAQRPDATRVMGYRAWIRLGHQVNQGEKGIAILAPCLYRAEDADTVAPAIDDSDTEIAARVLRGYRVVHVFDISQTKGEAMPDQPRLLQGEDSDGIFDQLSALLREDGFTVRRGDCAGANGVTRFTDREVVVRDDVDPIQAVKTLAHELGHVRADHEHRFLGPDGRTDGCRGRAEVEAESIAFLIMTSAGYDTSTYSVPYVAGWSGGDLDLIRESATAAIAVAGPVNIAIRTVLSQRDRTIGQAEADARSRTPTRAPVGEHVASAEINRTPTSPGREPARQARDPGMAR